MTDYEKWFLATYGVTYAEHWREVQARQRAAQRTARQRGWAVGIGLVAGFLVLIALPTGDSWSPHWIASTIEALALLLSVVLWFTAEDKESK
jgi:hypothetical protein